MWKVKLFILIFFISVSAYAETRIVNKNEQVSVKLKQREAIFGIKDGVDIDIFLDDKVLFSTSLKNFKSVKYVEREIVSFVNLQKRLAESYGQQLKLNVEEAQKWGATKTPLDAIKSLFSFEVPNTDSVQGDINCINGLINSQKATSFSQALANFSQEKVNNLIKNEVLLVSPKEIEIKYSQQSLLGVNDGVYVDLYIKGEIVYSEFFANSKSVDDVKTELAPVISKINNSKKPFLLQFGKAKKRSLSSIATPKDHFFDLFDIAK